jgi:hypothetical protein
MDAPERQTRRVGAALGVMIAFFVVAVVIGILVVML